MTYVRLHQPELVKLINNRSNNYIRMYLSEFTIDGDCIISPVHNNVPDLKLSIEDMCFNIDCPEAEQQIQEFWRVHNDNLQFHVVKIVEL